MRTIIAIATVLLAAAVLAPPPATAASARRPAIHGRCRRRSARHRPPANATSKPA